uniref:Uncharacterized protein n=1 Tax=Arundo donax TaxID=35708 RepID=A0A0A9D606_ARUDO
MLEAPICSFTNLLTAAGNFEVQNIFDLCTKTLSNTSNLGYTEHGLFSEWYDYHNKLSFRIHLTSTGCIIFGFEQQHEYRSKSSYALRKSMQHIGIALT